jgi:hypothetical protein
MLILPSRRVERRGEEHPAAKFASDKGVAMLA